MWEKVYYICDGKVPDCSKTGCYKHTIGGECRYTSNVENAANFEPVSEKTGKKHYVEKPIKLHTDPIDTLMERLKSWLYTCQVLRFREKCAYFSLGLSAGALVASVTALIVQVLK